MKRTFYLYLALVLLLVAPATLVQTSAQLGPGSHPETDQCTTPTTTVVVGTATSGLKFNVSEVKVPKNACVKITFQNVQSVNHDFVVDAVNGLTGFQIPGNNGSKYLGVTNSINIKTPDKDFKTEFYCSIIGHRAGGMYGTFIVGNPSSGSFVPGFEILTTLFAISAIGTLVYFKRK